MKIRLVCEILMTIEFPSQVFKNISDIKSNENPSSLSRDIPWGKMNGESKMAKLTDSTNNFAIALKSRPTFTEPS